MAGVAARIGTVLDGVQGTHTSTKSSVPAAVGRRRLVLVVTASLFLFGLVMITSAASGSTLLKSGDQWIYFREQILFGLVGLFAMVVAMRIPLDLVQRLAVPLILGSSALLMLVFVIGESVNGAQRWIPLPGGFQVQSSEFVKLAVVIYVADHLSRAPLPVHWVKDIVRSPGGKALGLAGIVLVQRDLGTAMIIGAVMMTLYMLAGTDWRLLCKTVGPVLALLVFSIVTEPFRRDRFLAFLDPWGDPVNGYQLVQALIAIGSGGPFGVGLGHSVQKIHFLPEAHTDMIFAVIMEELGIVGMLVVLGGFLALAVVGTRIAMKATTRFHALMAAGITAMLCGQAALNIGGVVGVLPLTGVPLPLISSGGSNLLVSLIALGLLANLAVAQHGVERPPASREADGASISTSPTANTRSSWWHRRARRARAGGS